MENTPAGRKATKTRIGPWYVLQRRNPAAPGMKFDTLLGFVRKGRIKSASVVRGPTTHQLWRFACQVKGLSREFGVCYSCAVELTPTTSVCPRCNRSQEPPARPDEFLENPNFSAVANGRAGAFRTVAPASPASPTGQPAEEPAALVAPTSSDEQHAAAHLLQMESEHAGEALGTDVARVVDLGETTFGAIVSAREADDGGLHTDLILPALGLPLGDEDAALAAGATPSSVAATPTHDTPRAGSGILSASDVGASAAPSGARPPSPVPVTTRITSGPRVVPKMALPPRPGQNGSANGVSGGSRAALVRRGDRPSVRVLPRQTPTPAADIASASTTGDAPEEGVTNSGSISANAVELAPTPRPPFAARPKGSKVRFGIEAFVFLLVLGAAVFAGLLYVDPHLQQQTMALLHFEQHPSPDGTAPTPTASVKDRPLSINTATAALSAAHAKGDTARHVMPAPPAPAAVPLSSVTTATPAPSAPVEPPAAPPIAVAPTITETPAPVPPPALDTESAVDEARSLWRSALDAEGAHDYAKAITQLEQVQRLPRAVWPGGLELKLRKLRTDSAKSRS